MAFSLNASQIISASMRKIRALGHGETLQGEDLINGIEALNIVLQYVQELGQIPINLTTETIDMVASTATYSLNSDVVDILYAYVRDAGGSDYKVDIISSNEYDRIYDKDQEETLPTKLYFERLATPQITLWPVPNDATIDVVVRELRSTAESTAGNGTLDINEALYSPVLYLLAAELAPEYGHSLQSANQYRGLGMKLLSDILSEIKDKSDSDSVPGAFDA